MKLDKSQIARQFSRAANTYDAVSQLQVEMSDRLIDEIPVIASGKLVDLGCGTGVALRKIEELDRFELTGIDIAPGMIRVARNRVPTGTFICCDLEHTPLMDNSIDIIFSNAAIQWCDCRLAIREMMRISRPDGIVIASTLGPNTLKEWRTAWNQVEHRSDRIHQFRTSQEIKEVFDKTGFQSISVESSDYEFSFQSVDSMLSSIKQLGATNASPHRNTSLSGRDQLRNVRSLFEGRLQQDGKLTVTFESIMVIARKPGGK